MVSPGTLRVKVQQGANVYEKGLEQPNGTFVRLSVGSSTRQTRVQAGPNPLWNESFTFGIPRPDQAEPLCVELWGGTGRECLCRVCIPLSHLPEGRLQEHPVLVGSNGKLVLELQAFGLGHAPAGGVPQHYAQPPPRVQQQTPNQSFPSTPQRSTRPGLETNPVTPQDGGHAYVEEYYSRQVTPDPKGIASQLDLSFTPPPYGGNRHDSAQTPFKSLRVVVIGILGPEPTASYVYYCLLTTGSDTRRTTRKSGFGNPQWNEELVMDVTGAGGRAGAIHTEVFAQGARGHTEVIGAGAIHLSELKLAYKTRKEVPLRDGRALVLELEPSGSTREALEQAHEAVAVATESVATASAAVGFLHAAFVARAVLDEAEDQLLQLTGSAEPLFAMTTAALSALDSARVATFRDPATPDAVEAATLVAQLMKQQSRMRFMGTPTPDQYDVDSTVTPRGLRQPPPIPRGLRVPPPHLAASTATSPRRNVRSPSVTAGTGNWNTNTKQLAVATEDHVVMVHVTRQA